MNTLKEHIVDQKKVLNAAKDNYRWLKSVHKRFWLLEHIFKNRKIEVSNWESFEPDPEHYCDGIPSGIDVNIHLPPLFRDIYYCLKGYLDWRREFKSFPKTRDYLPWFSDKWIFEIHNIESFYNLPHEEQYFLLCECKPQYKKSTIPNFYVIENNWNEWVREHLPHILLSGPLVTYDDVWTSEKDLKKDHVVKYTKKWIEKWYPGLSKREVEYKEIESV